MLLIFMGPTSTGKSTIAEHYKLNYNFEVYFGKDYIQFSYNEREAWKIFSEKLLNASMNNDLNKSIIFIVNDFALLKMINRFCKATFIKFTASKEVIIERIENKKNGIIPHYVENILEKQLKEWNKVNADICIDTTNFIKSDIIEKINQFLSII